MPKKTPKRLKITLVRSLIDTKPVHKRNALALGLRKLGTSRIHEDNPVIRGMIAQIPHLVKVEEFSNG
ncbi:50S ribosomal protein L30 [candidate division WOR-3 bacterium]|uniref:50S ribosomal protein L30 n=1 Tax=candidate division WOR-3 bacterium TaxID=2052148 RepID=A0A9D5QBS8_UNCW3|nr:50S ribosomal protein L30 [candidate division WOR-3 bacterium]MBD3363794.1 50S ribosomal protein L30 [candidate division WOR-3 bacterium]